MTPPNEHTSESGDDRGVPYHAESTLSSAQVLKEVGARGGDAVASNELQIWREFKSISTFLLIPVCKKPQPCFLACRAELALEPPAKLTHVTGAPETPGFRARNAPPGEDPADRVRRDD